MSSSDTNPFIDGKLSLPLSRLLSDKLYEKRKAGALQIERFIKRISRYQFG
jgi:hypothetical protein